jgi:trans-aconitate 2-methyltransferase
MDPWNPEQYDKFRAEREQPFFDLLALVQPAPDMRIVDLGCGTGAPTRVLHDRLHARETVGIDRSSRMLDKARESGLPERLRFEVGTIESFSGHDEYDLIFSNAAFHWVDDHDALITRLTEALRPMGQLAFQVPAMHDDPSHTIADEITALQPFREAFAGWTRRQPVLLPEDYARLFDRCGFTSQHVRLVIYPHVLPEPEDVVEWMKGTLLTDYERRITPALFARFLDEYRGRLLPRLDERRPFVFPFKRILCWGRRPGVPT